MARFCSILTDRLPGALEHLYLNLLSSPSAKELLILLDGVRSGEQLAQLLKLAGDSLALDADFVRPQLVEWYEAWQAEPQGTGETDKQRTVDELKATMAAAPADFCWSLLGSTLAYRLTNHPLEIRHTLKNATDIATLWPAVVEAIHLADGPATVSLITTIINEQISPTQSFS